jgi:hypothetical protein
MKDLPNDATASTAPVRKAACSAVGTANARIGQLWRDALAPERGAAARRLQTSRDDLATDALRRTADTQSERLTARYDPKLPFGVRETNLLGAWIAAIRGILTPASRPWNKPEQQHAPSAYQHRRLDPRLGKRADECQTRDNARPGHTGTLSTCTDTRPAHLVRKTFASVHSLDSRPTSLGQSSTLR